MTPAALRSIPGLRTMSAMTAGAISVETFTRGDGEVVWHHPQHRLVLPLTGADARKVTVRFEDGRPSDFVWRDALGFYPAGTRARIYTTSAKSLQLLWTPDPATAGRLAPLLPFEDALIGPCARAVAREVESGFPDRLFVESLGNSIVIKLMRHFATANVVEAPRHSGLSRERLRRVTEYIDAHLGEELTLDAIAAVACLSPYHLSRSFRRATGIGLHRYVVQRRIDRARHLVLETDLSMGEIAWKVGFGSQAAFATRFRRETGQAPSQMRRDRA